VIPLLAHLVSTGVGPFFDGAAHFFVSFDEALPILALALHAGLRGPRAGRWLIALLPLAWLAGGLLGLALPGGGAPPIATAAVLLIPGALLAWDRELPLAGITGVSAALGLAIGFWSGQAIAVSGAGARGVLGSAVAAFLVATLAAALATKLRDGWPRIAIRVAGSWISALGLLALGWTFRK
jgi:hydrogenase/urease accessory protein HupE